MQNGMTMIINERFRQICQEGWTESHDDVFAKGELAAAARCYLSWANYKEHRQALTTPAGWPFDPKWWKPKSELRNLVRAGALYLAERDRLIRAGEQILSINMHKSALDVATMIDSFEGART